MQTATLTASTQATRRSNAKKAAPQPAVALRAVPRLDVADKSVFETIAASRQFTLAGLKKLVAR
jgi:hypothetical protein